MPASAQLGGIHQADPLDDRADHRRPSHVACPRPWPRRSSRHSRASAQAGGFIASWSCSGVAAARAANVVIPTAANRFANFGPMPRMRVRSSLPADMDAPAATTAAPAPPSQSAASSRPKRRRPLPQRRRRYPAGGTPASGLRPSASPSAPSGFWASSLPATTPATPTATTTPGTPASAATLASPSAPSGLSASFSPATTPAAPAATTAPGTPAWGANLSLTLDGFGLSGQLLAHDDAGRTRGDCTRDCCETESAGLDQWHAPS